MSKELNSGASFIAEQQMKLALTTGREDSRAESGASRLSAWPKPVFVIFFRGIEDMRLFNFSDVGILNPAVMTGLFPKGGVL